MVRVEDSDGARDTRPGRFGRPSAATVDGMMVVSSRLAFESESLYAVWGRAGKWKVGSTSGREVIIINRLRAPSDGATATSLDSAHGLF